MTINDAQIVASLFDDSSSIIYYLDIFKILATDLKSGWY
jgi:hypothetical protein